VADSVVLTGATQLKFVVVAFDAVGTLAPSIPVTGTYVRYDFDA
jgi:hypothetical protein